MPWCPKCKNEYREGIAVCADCGIDLADELPTETDPRLPIVLCHVDTEEIGEKFVAYLHYGDLQTPALVRPEQDGEGFDLIVAGFEQEAAEAMFARFHSIEEMTEMDLAELVPDVEKQLEELQAKEASHMFSELRTEASSVYVRKKDKYADLKFSGISFLVFGILGIGFAILNQIEVIRLFNGFSMMIMTIVFILFTIVGITSLVRAKKLKDIVSEEERVTTEVMAWIEANINDEQIAALIDPAGSEEDNYFSAHETLCRQLMEQFPFFSRSYAEELMDERYNDYCERH